MLGYKAAGYDSATAAVLECNTGDTCIVHCDLGHIFGCSSITTATGTIEFVYLTPSPTNSPTAPSMTSPSRSPTHEPSDAPSRGPTHDPTREPTADPTSDPSLFPTSNPTLNPTRDPTAEPTLNPTKDPTPAPSNDPTTSPTAAPSAPPSSSPTATPTAAPLSLVQIFSANVDDESNLDESAELLLWAHRTVART